MRTDRLFLSSLRFTAPTCGTEVAGRAGAGHALQVPGDHAHFVRNGLRDRELGRVAVLQEYLKLDLDVCMDVSTGRIPRPGDHTDRDHRPLRLLRSLAPTPSGC